jgi:hypothetical protein
MLTTTLKIGLLAQFATNVQGVGWKVTTFFLSL